MTGRLRSRVPLLLTALLLAAAAAAAALAGPELTEAEPEFPRRPPSDFQVVEGAGQPAASPPLAEDRDGRAGWLGDLVLVAWLAAGLVGLLLLVWAVAGWRRRSGGGARWLPARSAEPEPAAAPEPGEQPLLAALEAGLAALDDDDHDPRRAVIACWVRLAEAATTAGVPQHPTDTAGDLVVRLLRSHQVSEPVLARLAEVYRLARYATHEVDETMRATARAALQRLRDELRQGRRAEPQAAGPAPGSPA